MQRHFSESFHSSDAQIISFSTRLNSRVIWNEWPTLIRVQANNLFIFIWQNFFFYCRETRGKTAFSHAHELTEFSPSAAHCLYSAGIHRIPIFVCLVAGRRVAALSRGANFWIGWRGGCCSALHSLVSMNDFCQWKSCDFVLWLTFNLMEFKWFKVNEHQS